MDAQIASFRRSLKHTYGNQMILFIENCETKEQAQEYVGKNVEYATGGSKIIKGTITKPHGVKGRLLARFEKGMPGQSLGRTVEIK